MSKIMTERTLGIGLVAIVVVLMIILTGSQGMGQKTQQSFNAIQEELRALLYRPVVKWRFIEGNPAEAEGVDFDDSNWEVVSTPHRWPTPDSVAWYRATVTIPETIAGFPCADETVEINVNVDDRAVIWVDGTRQGAITRVFDTTGILAGKARPGDTHVVAIKVVNNAGSGGLRWARLAVRSGRDRARQVASYLGELEAIGRSWSPDEMRAWDKAVTASVALLDMEALRANQGEAFLRSLGAAAQCLAASTAQIIAPVRVRFEALEQQLPTLERQLAALKEKGVDVAYPLASVTALRLGVEYGIKDLDTSSVPCVHRAKELLPSLEDMAGRVRQEMARDALPAVPCYKTGPVTIEDGVFVQNGRPVFFTGFNGEADPKLHDLGFNMINLVCPSSPSPADDPAQVNMRPVADMVAMLDRAAEQNMAVDVLFHPRIPGWMYERYPELQRSGWGFIPYDISHPRVREQVERFMRLYLGGHGKQRGIANHPALLSYCLMNEPLYTDGSEASRRAFQAYLKRQHGDIAKVNALFHASYDSFADIPGVDVYHNYHKNRPLWVEWCRFNAERLLDWHRWMRDLIREYDPHTPIHTKVEGVLFEGQRYAAWGMDAEAFANLDHVSGNDNLDHLTPNGPYAQNWVRQQIYYTFQRSVAPDNPIHNSENHLVDSTGFVPGRHVRTCLWIGAMEGQGANTNWLWTSSPTDWGYPGANYVRRANCVEALGRTTLDLNRLSPYFAAFARQRAQVAILFTMDSVPLNERFLEASSKAFEGAYLLDMPLRFVTDRQVAKGKLADYKLVVVPSHLYIDQETLDRLADYVKRGGYLLVAGDTLTHDLHGDPRHVTALFGTATLPSAPMVKTLGRGKLVYRPNELSAAEYGALVAELSEEAGVVQSFHVRTPKATRPRGVYARGVVVDGKLAVSLVNFNHKPLKVRIETAGGHDWHDAVNDMPVPRIIELRSLEPMLVVAK